MLWPPQGSTGFMLSSLPPVRAGKWQFQCPQYLCLNLPALASCLPGTCRRQVPQLPAQASAEVASARGTCRGTCKCRGSFPAQQLPCLPGQLPGHLPVASAAVLRAGNWHLPGSCRQQAPHLLSTAEQLSGHLPGSCRPHVGYLPHQSPGKYSSCMGSRWAPAQLLQGASGPVAKAVA